MSIITSLFLILITALISSTVAYRFGINKEMKVQRNTKLKTLYDDLSEIIDILPRVPIMPNDDGPRAHPILSFGDELHIFSPCHYLFELIAESVSIQNDGLKLKKLLDKTFGNPRLIGDEHFLTGPMRDILHKQNIIIYADRKHFHADDLYFQESIHESLLADCHLLREEIKSAVGPFHRFPLF